jgi:hypothetical protein
VFGPFAGVWDKLRARRDRATARPDDDRTRRGWLVAASVALLLLLGLLLLTRDTAPKPVAVPDLSGENVVDASAQLRTRGFEVGGVSYRPVTEGKSGIVLATIPSAKEMVAPGSSVHLIASALAATPEPVVSDDDRPRNKRGKVRRDRDDD